MSVHMPSFKPVVRYVTYHLNRLPVSKGVKGPPTAVPMLRGDKDIVVGVVVHGLPEETNLPVWLKSGQSLPNASWSELVMSVEPNSNLETVALLCEGKAPEAVARLYTTTWQRRIALDRPGVKEAVEEARVAWEDYWKKRLPHGVS